jgi:RimJ/RimL family protein N-acetyltransferase
MGDILVYRTNTPKAEPSLPDGVDLKVVRTFHDGLRIAARYASVHGWAATLKMLAKIATPRRAYYAASRGGRIVSEGWIQRGICKFYPVGRDDYVIGPIHTDARERGQGLATGCLVRATNHCLDRGARWVYIDTTRDNTASQKMIAKSGFQPLARET